MPSDVDTLELILCSLEEISTQVKTLMEPHPRLMDEEKAARYIGKSTAFLRLSRSNGVKAQGPDYVQIGGQVRYAREDLDHWIDELPRKKGSLRDE